MPAPTESVRLKIRERVLKDTFFFNKVVMCYPDIDVDPHYGLCEFLDRDDWLRKMLLAPRDTVKSWCVRGWAIQQVMRNPNLRILYVMSSEPNAKTPSRHIDNVFQQNTILRWLFPERIPNFNDRDVVWNTHTRTIPRDSTAGEATFTFAGIGTNLVGQHFDIIILDDTVEEEAAKSELVMGSVIDWFAGCEALLNDTNPLAQILVVGTRWHLRDLYQTIMGQAESTKLRVFQAQGDKRYMVMKRAGIENGKPYWAKKLSIKKLMSLKEACRNTGNESRFYLQYMNDPVNEDNCEFPRHMIRYYNWTSSGQSMQLEFPDDPPVVINPKSLRYTMTVDPAFEIGRRYDKSAICIIGTHPRGWKILMHAWTGQVRVNILKDKIINLCKQFRRMGVPIALVGIEKVGGQRTLIPYVKEDGRRQGIHIPIKDDLKKSTRESKDNFIRGFINIVAGGWYFTHRRFIEQNQEMDFFPSGEKNFLDALATQPQLWNTPENIDGELDYDDEDFYDEDDELGVEERESGYGG